MKKIFAILICCIVLQIAQCELLTLSVLALAGLRFTFWLIIKAGERGVL